MARRNSLYVEGVLLTPRACYWIAAAVDHLAGTYAGTDVGAALEEVAASVRRGRDAYLLGRSPSAGGSAEAVTATTVPPSPHDELDTEAAGEMLGVGARRVRQIAEELGGRKVAGRWRFARALLENHLDGGKAP